MTELKDKLAEAMRKDAGDWSARYERDPYFMHLSDAALKVFAEWLDERPLDPAHALSRTIRGE